MEQEVDYCLYCHERGKDSCSQGLREKDGELGYDSPRNPELVTRFTGRPPVLHNIDLMQLAQAFGACP